MEKRKWADVLHIVSGKNQKDVQNPNGKYPIYGSGGKMGYADEYLCEPGTTIVGRKGTINRPIYVDEPFWNIDTAFGVTPDEGLDSKYLFYFCVHFNFMPLDKSTGRPSLAKSDLLKIEMPVPSIDEQHRIVSQIEELFSELDNSVSTLQKTKEQLAVHRQAVLKDAFKGNYNYEPLSTISKAIGGYAFKSKMYSDSGKYIVVKIGNVKSQGFDFTRDLTKTTECDKSILEKYLLKKGDCVISLTGSRGKRDYGFVCIISDENNYLVNQRVAALRFDTKRALPEFYYYYLASLLYRDDFFKYETGNVGQGNVGIKALIEPMVPVPSINEQEELVTEIESRLSVCDSIEHTVDTALQQAETMRQSILKQAFEGRL